MEFFTFSTRTTFDLLQLAHNKFGLLGWNYSKNKTKAVSLRKKLATKNLIKFLGKIVQDEYILEKINQQSRKRPCPSDGTTAQPMKLAKTDFDWNNENGEGYIPQEDFSQSPIEHDWNQSTADMYQMDMEDFNNESVQYEGTALTDDDPIFADLGFLFEDN